MNILSLANRQLNKEGLQNKQDYLQNLLDRAIKIRKYLDYQNRGKAISKAKNKERIV